MYLKTQIQLTKDEEVDLKAFSLQNGLRAIEMDSSTYNYNQRTGESRWTSTGLTLILGPQALSQVDRLIAMLQDARRELGACDHCENGTVYDAIYTPDGERREANPCPKCKGAGQL